MLLGSGYSFCGLRSLHCVQGQGDDGLSIVASEEPPGAAAPVRPWRPVPMGNQMRTADGQILTISEASAWGQQPSRGLAYAEHEMRAQNRAARPERAARPRTESHLETLAGMLSSESGLGEAETRARILDITGALRDAAEGGVEARQSAAGAPDRAIAQQPQQPGLRVLEHRSTVFLQDLRQNCHRAQQGPPPSSHRVFLAWCPGTCFLCHPVVCLATEDLSVLLLRSALEHE